MGRERVNGRAPTLAARHVSKRFGGVRALDDVALTVLPGEVHALLGENGSGKSTLIKILAGYHAPDPGGELEVDGRAVTLPLRPGEARVLGLSFVHQDLGLISSLSVLDNLRIGEMSEGLGWWISRRDERRRARETFARHDVRLDPDALVRDLAPHERALLALVRAVEELGGGEGKGVLVLDETTVFLRAGEREELFALVHAVAAAGASVLFVTHDLGEVRAVADRMTVLRDGRAVGTVGTADVGEAELAELILGRRVQAFAAERLGPPRKTAVSVSAVEGNLVRGLSLELGPGEVVGVTGRADSGHDEVPYLLFGTGSARGGRVGLGPSSYDLPAMTPSRAVAAGIALVPRDRQWEGSVGSLSVADNVTLPVLARFASRLRLDRARLLRHARQLLARFDVRPRDPRLPYDALSGGNQQKALLAKWLQTAPALLLLDEPTQGVDVGARQEILALVRAAAAEGASILYAGTDHKELAAVCDRVLVLSRGRIAHELGGSGLTAERIAELCLRAA